MYMQCKGILSAAIVQRGSLVLAEADLALLLHDLDVKGLHQLPEAAAALPPRRLWGKEVTAQLAVLVQQHHPAGTRNIEPALQFD
jgi:hypothetical protein